MRFSKARRRKKIHMGIRNKISGTSARPRLSVYRSNKEIYCQLIDDLSGSTLLAASSKNAGIDKKLSKIEQAKEVGKILAEKAKGAGVERVVFDRSGYLFHGRVKALAEGAKEGGLAI